MPAPSSDAQASFTVQTQDGLTFTVSAQTPRIALPGLDGHPQDVVMELIAASARVVNETSGRGAATPTDLTYHVIVRNPGRCNNLVFGCDATLSDAAFSYGPAVNAAVGPPGAAATWMSHKLRTGEARSYSVVRQNIPFAVPRSIDLHRFWWYVSMEPPSTYEWWTSPAISGVHSSDGSAVPASVVAMWRLDYDALARHVPAV